ncbi:MAG: tRNA wybutosine-synthesizing 3 family protein, partial [Candidatus Woesearchaeota archaeon]
MNFQNEKKTFLSKKDKSIEGKIDKHIKKLCSIINKNKNFYTTSSCSGRIVLIERSDRKDKTIWLLKSHDKITLNKLLPAIKKIKKTASFRFEPTIIHICAKNLEAAEQILHLFYNNGFKRSGIIGIKRKITIEVIGTGRLEAPVLKNVPKEYLKLLVEQANNLWENNYRRIKKMEKLLDKHYNH